MVPAARSCVCWCKSNPSHSEDSPFLLQYLSALGVSSGTFHPIVAHVDRPGSALSCELHSVAFGIAV